MAKKNTNQITEHGFKLKENEINIILNFCLKEIKKILNNNKLSFEEINLKSQNKKIITFQKNLYVTNAESYERQRSYTVTPLLNLVGDSQNLEQYFINLAFIIKENSGQEYFNGISVRVFRGLYYDPNKIELFRAEWDIYQEGKDTHSQPHWHFLTGQKNNINFNFLENENDKILDFEVNRKSENNNFNLDAISKIHFAMSSNWFINGSQSIIVKDLKNYTICWLRGLITYIIDEIKYISE